MIVRLPYGDTWREEAIPQLVDAWVLEPDNQMEPVPDLAQAVDRALQSPSGSARLRDLLRPHDRIAIIISDITRPSPSQFFLDGIAQEMKRAAVPFQNATIVVATGAHRASTMEESVAMVGHRHHERFDVLTHDCRDSSALVHLGQTKRGVPVWVNRAVAQADFRIATGVITPHHSAGYSGGRKAILPGVSGELTIRRHHSFPIRPLLPALGQLEGNPAHEEALQAAEMLGVNLVINAVPAPSGSGYLGVVAGGLVEAHMAGVQICEKAYQVEFASRFDLAICSPGGYPRDINLHQAQKALTTAELVTRPGGAIILVAECRNGVGSEFARWLQMAKTPEQVMERFRADGWSMSSGKAMMFARAAMGFRIWVVSNAFDADFLATLFLKKANSLQEAVAEASTVLGEQLRAVIIPRASGLIPSLIFPGTQGPQTII